MTSRITNTILTDLAKIITKSDTQFGFRPELALHLPNDVTIKPYSIDIISIERDFVNNNFDVIELRCMMPLGSLIHDVFPNKDLLEATLVLSYSVLKGERLPDNLKPIIRRYKVKLPSLMNEQAQSNNRYTQNKTSGDHVGYQDVTFILSDLAKDQILHSTVSTIARRTTSANALKGILTSVFNDSLLSKEFGISGVNLAPGWDTTEHECIIVPQLLEVLAIPKHIQESECGVYPGGIGTYIQNNVCFLYPPYDTTQVSKGVETITILNIPPDIYKGAETTWALYEGEFFIMSTGESIILDTTQLQQASLGSGIHYINADAILRPGYSINESSITLPEDNNLVSTFMSSKRDKFNFSTHGTRLITSNHMNENSQLAKRSGSNSLITWENSKLDIIKPGMGVRVLTLNGINVSEYHGTIHRVLHSIVPKTSNIKDQFFVSNTKIDVFLSPKPYDTYEL
jgi:hypothetical protein